MQKLELHPKFNPDVFLNAQSKAFSKALAEIKAGRKQSHWMWFIFPQLRGLGRSFYSDVFGLGDVAEATEFLQHPTLGGRLRECVHALMPHGGRHAKDILGTPDHLKLHACLTLFNVASPRDIFADALDTFFDGRRHSLTLEIIDNISTRTDCPWTKALMALRQRSLNILRHAGNAVTGKRGRA
jgi:uncharacterized protein (DUF1810 family)